MRTPPLLADFSHARACKPFCENSLTLPLSAGLKEQKRSRYIDAPTPAGALLSLRFLCWLSMYRMKGRIQFVRYVGIKLHSKLFLAIFCVHIFVVESFRKIQEALQ